jgi:hypothetical protein
MLEVKDTTHPRTLIQFSNSNKRGERVLLGVVVDEVKFLAPQLSLPQEPARYERMTVDTLADVLTKPTLWIEETLSFVSERMPSLAQSLILRCFGEL